MLEKEDVDIPLTLVLSLCNAANAWMFTGVDEDEISLRFIAPQSPNTLHPYRLVGAHVLSTI